MKITLSKPLVFLDLETTGVNPKEDRICEISMLKKIAGSNNSFLYSSRVNPGVNIPEAASKVHGLTNEILKEEVPFVYIAKEVYEFISGCDIAGFNSNSFDVPLLYTELQRAGIKWDWKSSHFLDIGNIYKIKESRTLSAAYMYYCEKKLEKAHNSAADVEATYEVFLQQLKMYEKDPEFKQLDTIPKLAFYSNYNKEIVDITGCFVKDDQGELIFNFGKHKGEVAKNHHNYLYYMIKKDSGFPDEVKEICQRLLFKKGNRNPVLAKKRENKLF